MGLFAFLYMDIGVGCSSFVGIITSGKIRKALQESERVV